MGRPTRDETGDWYEIRLGGRLDPRWAALLDGLDLVPDEDGSTVLRGRVPDQAALHGVLRKVRDVGLPIISVALVNSRQQPGTGQFATHHDKENPMSTLQSTSTTTRRGPVPRNSLRTIASIVGWLFIVTYVTSIAAKVAFYPPLFDGDYVTAPGQDTRVLWGAVSEAVLIIANIGTATFLWPVLKRQHESLAMSYVAARIMESVFIAVGILSVLTVVTLRQTYAAADAGATAGLTVAGDAFVNLQEWTFGLGPNFVVGVGNGVILGYLMYRSRLVPRTLAVLGLVGGPLLILSSTAAMVGIIELDGTWQILSAVPEFFWELGLGIYLVVKGFKASPVTAGMDDER